MNLTQLYKILSKKIILGTLLIIITVVIVLFLSRRSNYSIISIFNIEIQIPTILEHTEKVGDNNETLHIFVNEQNGWEIVFQEQKNFNYTGVPAGTNLDNTKNYIIENNRFFCYYQSNVSSCSLFNEIDYSKEKDIRSYYTECPSGICYYVPDEIKEKYDIYDFSLGKWFPYIYKINNNLKFRAFIKFNKSNLSDGEIIDIIKSANKEIELLVNQLSE
jgi:hypothetical protein